MKPSKQLQRLVSAASSRSLERPMKSQSSIYWNNVEARTSTSILPLKARHWAICNSTLTIARLQHFHKPKGSGLWHQTLSSREGWVWAQDYLTPYPSLIPRLSPQSLGMGYPNPLSNGNACDIAMAKLSGTTSTGTMHFHDVVCSLSFHTSVQPCMLLIKS